jgi:hypothetical protein
MRTSQPALLDGAAGGAKLVSVEFGFVPSDLLAAGTGAGEALVLLFIGSALLSWVCWQVKDWL